ncbi:MAG: HpcH/HpaI aldolase/citrate lyase family protein [Oscillospiraceae bacterium]
MKNIIKENMLKGQKVLGTFCAIGNEVSIECLGYSGLDYAIIDTEHGPGDAETALNLIRTAKYVGFSPFVRVKDSNRNSILKMLDVGAMGLIIPNVQSVDEVKEIVKYGKYFPLGERGIAPASGTNYWTKDYAKQGFHHYFEVCNNETLLIPQCETKGCLDVIEEVAAVEGVDGIFIGPFDLSTALGKPGLFADPEVSGAISRILKACRDAGKFAFIYANSEEDAAKYFKMGFDAVALGIDAINLINVYKGIVQRVRP